MHIMEPMLNKLGPSLFIAVHLSAGAYGVVCAMPKLYHNLYILYVMQTVTCFGLIQVLICWFVTKKVDSSFNPNSQSYVPNHGFSDVKLASNKTDTQKIETSLSIPSRNNFSGQSQLSYQNATNCDKVSNVNERKEKRTFHYWSWVLCRKCQIVCPPRCHHCSLCQKCILKRDHHCFFTGTCIGVKNQGHFIVFMFWAALVTLFGTFHMLAYTYWEILPMISYLDFIPPVSTARVVLGYVQFYIPLLCILFWALLIFTVFSCLILYGIVNVTMRGVTSFELDKNIQVTDCRTISRRWNDVLGEKWVLSFLLPSYFLKYGSEDALLWPHIKVRRL